MADWVPNGVIKWFTKKYLEGHAWKFAKEEKWESYGEVLALLMYAIILFPNIDNFIDHLAVEIFLSGNSMPFLLENFYHTFHTRHENKRGTFIYYALLLHICMKTHMPQKCTFVPKVLSWPQRFASLIVGYIQWYKREWETKNVILKCGGFLNVPLIGSCGCINYNPMLCMR